MTAPNYGMTHWCDLFTARQLLALTVFSDLVGEAREQVYRDALTARAVTAPAPPHTRDSAAASYADALAVYLAFVVDKMAPYQCSLVPWYPGEDRPQWVFARQAISMVWDFAEVNPFSSIGGAAESSVRIVADAVEQLPCGPVGSALQSDAAAALPKSGVLISTDPPYYDNVPYGDLSDFFYVWLRRSLAEICPELFATVLTPKAAELVADPFRHGGRLQAERFFEERLGASFEHIRAAQVGGFPLSVYYAFKQSEEVVADAGSAEGNGGGHSSPRRVASTGWETMLAGLLNAGFMLTGTWPLRTERTGRMRDIGSNALASSVVLVCRPRAADATTASRRDFTAALKRELPSALKKLQAGNIAPVDLAQAAIGPGMAVFSRYSQVLDASGQPLSIRTALQTINQVLDEVVTEQEGEFDSDTRWAVTWFEQRGFEEGSFGEAEQLSKARNVGINGLVEAAIVRARSGKVRLVRRDELPTDWNPPADTRLTVWETTQHLIRALQTDGEPAAGTLLRQVVAARGDLGEAARDLAYRLYLTCERKKWAQEAGAYNALVVSWPNIQMYAADTDVAPLQQTML